MPRQFEIRDENERIIAGFASVEIVDKQGDIIDVSELKRAMYKLMDRGGFIVYGHQNKHVGKILDWEIRKHPETGKQGLWLVAKIFNDYAIDDAVWQAIKQGKLTGFSIGGMGRLKKEKIKENGTEKEVNVVEDLQLFEISIVEEPANPLARIEEVNFFAKGISKLRIEKRDDGIYLVRKIDDIDKIEKAERINRVCEELKKIGYNVDYDSVSVEMDVVDNCELCKKVAKLFAKSAFEILFGRQLVGEDERRIELALDRMFRDYVAIMRMIKKLESSAMPKEEVKIEQLPTDNSQLIKEDKVVEVKKPFLHWDSFDDCVSDMRRKGYDEDSAKRICGSLQAKYENGYSEEEKQYWNAYIEFLKSVDKEFAKKLEDVIKEKDMRPPKEWWDRCIEATGRPALCGWIYYHHLKPTGAGDKITQQARERKREWLREQ